MGGIRFLQRLGLSKLRAKRSAGPSYLYRYRSIDSLFGEHNALEQQTIFFASPDALNDPMEGYKEMLWHGDAVVWRNLLKHYLLCLTESICLLGVLGPEFKESNCENLVYGADIDLPEAPIRDIFRKICSSFFQEPGPVALLDALPKRVEPIRRDELTFYFRCLQPLALHAIAAALGESGQPIILNPDELKAAAERQQAHIVQLAERLPIRPDLQHASFSAGEIGFMQTHLIWQFNNPITPEKKGWMFIARDFPAFYVRALDRLVYRPWYAACFSANPASAAMWGHYADKHQGVCLKFKAESIDLYRPTSWNSGGAIYEFRPHLFEAVSYTDERPEVRFFEALGNVSNQTLTRFWYAGPDGKQSALVQAVYGDEEKWGDKNRAAFRDHLRRKTPEWEYEQEYRVILTSLLADFREEKDRALKYRFSDLLGVVFGMRTSDDDKLRIMQAIERKCVAERRTTFEFLQARYSSRTRKIELAPLSLLKIRPRE